MQLLAKTNVKVFRHPRQRATRAVQAPWWSETQQWATSSWQGVHPWKQCMYPWKPCNWSAGVTAQVGNKRRIHALPLFSSGLNPRAPRRVSSCADQLWKHLGFLHLFFLDKYSTLTGLQPVTPAWESLSNLAGWGKGFTKPLT